MTSKEYKRFTSEHLSGRRAVTVRELRNSLARIPSGTTVNIRGKMGGLSIETDPCGHCNVQLWITKVSPYDVQLLPLKEG